jgi:uncharacterized protein YndB with AHSA1/START domain
MTESTTTVEPELGEVTITREYDAPRDIVFRAMIEPEQLTHFWGPTGMHTPLDKIVVEPFAGGRFETTMMPDDDPASDGYPMRAVFSEVTEPERIVWTEPDFGMTTTSTFTDLGDGRTRVVIHQTNVPEMFRTPEALAGFNTSLDKFAAYLAAR